MERDLAQAATGIYRSTAPLVQRHPGAIFISLCVLACLGAWLVALGVQGAWRGQRAMVEAGLAAPGEMLTVAELNRGLELAEVGTPALLAWPFQSLLVRDMVALGGVVGFVSVLAMFAIWWERKASAFIQSRLGPMRVGGWHGWSQSLADGIKLLCKEDLIPGEADRPLFRLAPYLSFVPALLAFVALPFGTYWVFRDLDVALLVILATLAIEVMGVLLAGWASNNKWSVYGAMREACQVVSYEIPLGMSLLIPIMIAGTLRLSSVAEVQAGGWFNWLAWHSPWAFAAMLTFFISSLAACKRAPFDLPEAESELVAGFHTEYSGFRWSLFFFAEYAAMFVVSALVVVLFLGGWDAPWAGLAPASWGRADAGLMTQLLYGVVFSGPLWFIAKAMVLVTVQMWLRWTLPRLRIDQVLYSCIQVMLPAVMVLLLASVFWELAVERSAIFAQVANVVSLVLGFFGLFVTIATIVVGVGAIRRRAVLVGRLGVDRPLPGG